MVTSVRIAVWGCGHGELDRVYDAIKELNARAADGRAVELLLCCGDFEAMRTPADLESMACPPKYRMMGDFHKYYTGEKQAPVLTLFVGGNHEASNYMQELFYGGWAAPNIYYMGFSGIVTFRGLRIAGVSGIYKQYNFNDGYYERPPYTENDVRSVFHCRAFDYFKLEHIRNPVDIVMSHDWPSGVHAFGDTAGLLRRKKHFREDIESGSLGNPASAHLLGVMQPRFWFSGHLHVKFTAVIPHAVDKHCSSAAASTPNSSSSSSSAANPSFPGAPAPSACVTRFLALDKCLPGRDFLQVLDIPVPQSEQTEQALPSSLCYDAEWLATVVKTHPLLPTQKRGGLLPHPVSPTGVEVEVLRQRLLRVNGNSLGIPMSAPVRSQAVAASPQQHRAGGQAGNPQTDRLLAMLGLQHSGITVPCAGASATGSSAVAPVAAASLGEPDEMVDASYLQAQRRSRLELPPPMVQQRALDALPVDVSSAGAAAVPSASEAAPPPHADPAEIEID